jgi:hypothetical protein
MGSSYDRRPEANAPFHGRFPNGKTSPLSVQAADIAAAAGLFQDHPHIIVFPGDGIDVMPVVTGPPED